MSLSSLIWSVAELLRGDYKQSDYGKVILPFTVLRRLDCVLAPTKKAVLAENAVRSKAGINPEPFLLRKSGASFYNTSPMGLQAIYAPRHPRRQHVFCADFAAVLAAVLQFLQLLGIQHGLQLRYRLATLGAMRLVGNHSVLQQAANNTKEQFANSPDLTNGILYAIMDALAAHSTMSKQALESEKVRSELRDVLLGPAQLYEALGSGPATGSRSD
jgi:HsdM N-terminal domain